MAILKDGQPYTFAPTAPTKDMEPEDGKVFRIPLTEEVR
jgi:hypothetical protein